MNLVLRSLADPANFDGWINIPAIYFIYRIEGGQLITIEGDITLPLCAN
jgi:hypothetical protein